jgi:outer membrane lipoprotein-sorting protein
MPQLRRLVPAGIALWIAVLCTSCGLVTHRTIRRNGKIATPAQTLLTATTPELVARINRIYDGIHSFQATVEMTPSIGSVYKGQITEIHDVHAYVLFRKPADIRIIGQLPVVGTRAFDMVSDGQNFRFYLVSKNLFVEGSNSAPATSKNKLENLRPQAFLSSMLVRPPEEGEHPFLEDQTDEENALYILQLVKEGPDGAIIASRSIWFDRLDLSVVRQIVYDVGGEILSDTRYSKWQTYNDVLFPSHIDINRLKDGYGVTMDITQMQMNTDLPADKFVLNQPPGAQVQIIGASTSQLETREQQVLH